MFASAHTSNIDITNLMNINEVTTFVITSTYYYMQQKKDLQLRKSFLIIF